MRIDWHKHIAVDFDIHAASLALKVRVCFNDRGALQME